MSDSNGHDRATFGGLTVFGPAVLIMVIAAAIGLLWTSVAAFRTEREIAYQQAQERCAGATNTDCQNLATAIRSAVADERAADFAAQQLWLNLIGVIGLGATVLFAAFAWREAQRSARAATASVDHLRVIERAYVFGGMANIKCNADSGRVSFNVVWQNSGKTPARVTKLEVGYHPIVSGINPDRFTHAADYSACDVYRSDTILSAGEGGPIVDKEGQATNGVVYGRLTYFDVFNVKHTSCFCVIYFGQQGRCQSFGSDSWNEYD